MGIVDNALIGASGQAGYRLTRSLRFRSSASASLTRTFGTPTNNKIWTLSFWVKRGTITSRNLIASTNTSGGTDGFYLDWDTDVLEIGQYTTSWVWQLQTTQIFRDPSAWYHIVYAVDTTQATAANRVKLYVNGTEVTAFRTASYPTQNLNTLWNQSAQPARFGYSASAAISFDAYLTEVNFIDGQALTPSSFGSTNALTGVWQPAAYTGAYGTNGFELQFTDNSAATAAAIGKDSSGNGNNWTPNNISVTAGVTYDSMTDVPTLTSATAANFAVLNPLNNSGGTTISDGNLKALWASASDRSVLSTFPTPSSGKFYAEFVVGTLTSANVAASFGLATEGSSRTGMVAANMWVYYASSQSFIVRSGTFSSQIGSNQTLAAGGILQVAIDRNNNQAWLGYNNVWINSTNGTTGDPSAGTNPTVTSLPADLFILVGMYANNGNVNFGQRPFTYTPPTGFVALNTFNLPTSTIVKGNTVMDATLYTANASTQVITNAAGFKPDFVWTKSRTGAYSHQLWDSIRGVNTWLQSNSTTAEQTGTAQLTSFNSNGFTLGANENSNFTNGYAAVGWQWQAGQGTNTTNTNGTITSTVSVNASAGFSVVTYTGTGALGTVGHGLGVAPSMLIIKSRSTADTWRVYHASLGNTQFINLNDTSAAGTASTVWNNTSPTSTVFTVNTESSVNGSGRTQVAYCWTPIAGYSSFGSYTGNGNADGPFVYLGFRPKFVLYKDTANGSTNWELVDSARNTYNPEFTRLFPNASNADDNAVNPVMDFTANGFKIRTSAFGVNNNGNVHIYMAFAENPLKNSLAR
jgi:hypothetical protein